MKQIALLGLVALAFIGCSSQNPSPHPAVGATGWFFPIQPPPGDGAIFFVGPYTTQAFCQDTFGSAIFSHPNACHLTGPTPPANCKNTGNGFAYPASYPYPPTINLTADQECVKLPVTAANNRSGLFFLFYGPNGASGVKECTAWAKDKKLADAAGSPYEIGAYADLQCPGAPCFTIPIDTACD